MRIDNYHVAYWAFGGFFLELVTLLGRHHLDLEFIMQGLGLMIPFLANHSIIFSFCARLVDVISKLGLQKASVLRHMASVIQPILEKGIVDHSIIHRVLMEYFSIADKVCLRFLYAYIKIARISLEAFSSLAIFFSF